MLLRSIRFGLMVVLLGMVIFVAFVAAAERGYRQVVNGVAIYFGIVPAELVRGHPPQHPEGQMHGGVPVGENHIMVALFNAQSGARLTEAEVHATIIGPSRYTAEKRLEPMVIAGSLTYGNDFYMTGPGPYRIVLRIRLPGETRGTARELHLGAVVNKRKPEASASQGRKQTQARHMARPAVHDWSRAQGLKPRVRVASPVRWAG